MVLLDRVRTRLLVAVLSFSFAAAFGVGSSARVAHASDATVAYFDSKLQPLGSRLASELHSEGYDVQLDVLPAEPGCEPYSDYSVVEASETGGVSIRLGRVTGSLDAACAAIALKTVSGATRHAQVTASINDVTRFSIKVAEALNGLSTRAPPNTEPHVDNTVPGPEENVQHETPAETLPVTFGAAVNVLLDANHVSPLLGLDVLVEVPLTPDWRMTLDTGATLNALSLEEDTTKLAARLAWARVGAAFRIVSRPIELDLTASAGAALTWVTARVSAPDVARADIATSAMFSAGTACAFPSDSPLQLYAAVRGTTLVPSIRFALPSGDSTALGYVMAEGALGARARW